MKGYLVMRLSRTVNAGGYETKIQNEGLLGVVLIFDTYDHALEWAGGDGSLVLECSMKDGA